MQPDYFFHMCNNILLKLKNDIAKEKSMCDWYSEKLKASGQKISQPTHFFRTGFIT